MKRRIEVTVLIPARDEAAAIGRVIDGVRASLGDEAFEILVVDDGSRDGTGEIARMKGARVLRTEGLGYGAAIKWGARRAKGRILALMDADGTYPEGALPALVAEVRAGARQAIGARPGWTGSEPWIRSAIKAGFRGAVRLGAGLEVPDLNSGMRALWTSDLLTLAPILPDRFSLTTTLTLALAAEGDRVVFLPIDYLPREGRSKWRPVTDTWKMGRTVLRGIGWLRRHRAPVALATLQEATWPPGRW